MPFPTEFPKDAIAAILKYQEHDAGTLALSAYELLGFGLHVAFGDVKHATGLDFATLSKIAEGADLAQKIKTKAAALKASGVPTFLLILQLLGEFGPVVLQLAQSIRAFLKA